MDLRISGAKAARLLAVLNVPDLIVKEIGIFGHGTCMESIVITLKPDQKAANNVWECLKESQRDPEDPRLIGPRTV